MFSICRLNSAGSSIEAVLSTDSMLELNAVVTPMSKIRAKKSKNFFMLYK